MILINLKDFHNVLFKKKSTKDTHSILFISYNINGQTDIAETSFGVQTRVGKVFIPIPKSELDISPNLTQNPGC